MAEMSHEIDDLTAVYRFMSSTESIFESCLDAGTSKLQDVSFLLLEGSQLAGSQPLYCHQHEAQILCSRVSQHAEHHLPQALAHRSTFLRHENR